MVNYHDLNNCDVRVVLRAFKKQAGHVKKFTGHGEGRGVNNPLKYSLKMCDLPLLYTSLKIDDYIARLASLADGHSVREVTRLRPVMAALKDTDMASEDKVNLFVETISVPLDEVLPYFGHEGG